MAEIKVIAHFMHEAELAEAAQRMHDTEITESYVIGRIDDSEVESLKDRGLLVQVVEEQPEEETAARFRAAVAANSRVLVDGLRVENETAGAFAAAGGAAADVAAIFPAAVPAVEVDETGPNFYFLRLGAPLLEQWRAQLEQLGVTLLEHVPPTSYTACLDPQQAHQVGALPFIEALLLYKPQDAGPVMLQAEGPPVAVLLDSARATAIQAFDIRLHRAEDMASVGDWLRDHSVAIAGSGGRKIRIYALEDEPILEEIGSLPAVMLVEQYIEPELFNDVARVLLGVDQLAAATVPPGLEGDGQIVAVADTGIDENHPDFAGRIVGVIALGRAGNASDPDGHGTHVAGSILGDGAASGGQVRGVAPKAKLFFQSLLDAQGRLGGLPVNLGDLFDDAYQAGARIHNNSWGAATESAYTLNSEDVDEFVANHRDMLIVIAAGNEGQASNRRHSPPGFPDWLSIGSPGSSKNALTVGASRSDRTAGGYSTLTWNGAWPADFPDPPIAGETISGDPESLAGFSSRGPCDDRRIKPDVVAPGTDILSTKSALAPSSHYWGPFPGGQYAFMGGTSMATPLVAGCIALVREYYVKQRQHQPSAALLKATIINGARWLTGADAIANQNAAPNYDQGFGAVHLPSTIPNPTNPTLSLEFVDTWQEPQNHLNRSGQRLRYTLTVAGGASLRICLTYTDIPARGAQNDLNLIVQEPGGPKHVGNEALPERLTELDRGNNVEVVRIDNPPTGDYLIQVSAFNLLAQGQDFALVVTGDLGSGLAPF